MKNLDIEKLERKNIYKVPDGFFEQMQSEVLNEIQPKQNAKIIKLNWVYAAAAAITLFFGITFVIDQNNQKEEVMTQVSNGENSSVTSSLSSNKIKSEATAALQVLEDDLVSANQKENTKPITIAGKQTKRENKIIPQNTEVQVEQILVNFTSAELADIGKNTEQDIYLDLYN